jgi:hypothetical protein
MSNVSTITPEDLERYPSLKGRQVGDVITAQERYKLQQEYAKKNDEPVAQPINSATGVTGIPSSIEGDESEAEESKATRRSSKK